MIATEYCKKVFDGTHDSPKPVEDGRLLITSKHIANRSLDISSAYLISEEDFENVNKRSQVHQWDILFSMIGTVGNVYIETSEKIDYAIKNMGVFSCQNKEKAYWLYYYLQSPLVQAKIDALMAGAVQKFVPLGFLRDLDIPEYTENSKKVVQVLSALDDKIALNKKMNQKLEAMAKRLYDYWFVQFDFPDKNGRPYKTTGGPMTYNPALKREIPAGWEVKTLADIADYVKTTTKFDKAFNYVSTDNMLPQKQGLSGENLKPASGNVLCYKKDDILISNIRPYFKKIWYADQSGTCSTDVLCIRSLNSDNSYFVYKTLWQDDFFDYVMQGAKGSKMPRGDKTRIMNYPICIAKENFEDLIKKFSALVVPMQAVIQKNTKEISRLTKLRDKLLPLLMNGQVTVG
ncbi:restriction endonuclease subunit S [Fibrobacter succinogenes]|uniref:restriction endonuclease subunit S n=1 Tax=Fibrobacter succinogenes TaxID=833 RepID=UPI0015691CA8|nr:restriction endonuclease subunit S [Fibrobacter succinogenes]